MFAYLHIENNSAGISKFCFFGKDITGLEPVWRKTSLKYFVYILAEVLEGEVFFILFYFIFLFLNVSVNNEQ